MMKPAHECFEVLEHAARKQGKAVLFISENTPQRQSWYSWIPNAFVRQVAYQAIKAIDMALEVLKARDARAVIIYEHKPQYCLPLYLALLLRGSKCAFFVHGIQQIRQRSLAHDWGFQLIRFLNKHQNFYAIHIEIDDRILAPEDRFEHERSTVVPHPISPYATLLNREKKNGRAKSIGVVGIIREDKPIGKILKIVMEYCSKNPELDLVVGTPFWQVPPWLGKQGLRLVDTARQEDYFALRNELDLVVADFDRDNFYFRPSGIINDAVSVGCRVVAPDYPVIKAQAQRPVVMGRFFAHHEEIPACLDELLLTQVSRQEIDAWRSPRTELGIFEKAYEPIAEHAWLVL